MLARLRLAIAAALVLGGAVVAAPRAPAASCPPMPGMGQDWCATPVPTPRPTPRPTPAPTAPPVTNAPVTQAPAAPVTRSRARGASAATSQPAVSPEESSATLPPEASGSPEIVVTTPLPSETAQALATRQSSRSTPTGWAFFVAGFLVGNLSGVVSFGMIRRRRKKQAIFG